MANAIHACSKTPGSGLRKAELHRDSGGTLAARMNPCARYRQISTTDDSQSYSYTQGGTVKTHLGKTKSSDGGSILMFDKGVGLDLRMELQRRAQSQLIEADRMSASGMIACSISHDMRYSLSSIYANAEFLECHDLCASARADLVLEIQEAVLATTERLDSILQFGSSGRTNPPVHERVSLVVKKAVAAVKFHPDGQNVSITVDKFPRAEADVDARHLESAIYNLLLNACQAAKGSTHVPEVKVHLREVH